MHKLFILISIMCFAVGVAVYPKQESQASVALPVIVPLPPAAGTAVAELVPQDAPAPAQKAAATAPAAASASSPVRSAGPLVPQRLLIPSIGLNDPIVSVGVNRHGEMDVPSGSTRNVGWYKGGTLPGETGSAVIGAHVFAAFERLDEVKPGGEILVKMSDGTTRTFIVESATVYKLSDMSADDLFNRADARRLNLITCAGTLTPDGYTYTHRLVVSAVLSS